MRKKKTVIIILIGIIIVVFIYPNIIASPESSKEAALREVKRLSGYQENELIQISAHFGYYTLWKEAYYDFQIRNTNPAKIISISLIKVSFIIDWRVKEFQQDINY